MRLWVFKTDFMTKEKLFKKYNIDETHKEWNNQIDNWISVEIFRIMHDGRLPNEKDTSFKYMVDFADKIRSAKGIIELRKREDFGSLYLTNKRLIYKFSEEILKEINKLNT